MTRRSDALTVALTGQLPFILVVATVLAFIASFLLLHLYRRRVIKSMRQRSTDELLKTKGYLPPEPEHKPNDAPLSFNFVDRDTTGAPSEAEKLFRSARRRRWLTALVHTLAGACFAATMTAAFLSAGKMDVLPFRFAFLTWIHIWPALMAIDLVVGPSRRSKLFGLLVYCGLGAMIATIVLVKNPGLPIGQLLYLWLDANAIPTLLLLIFLNRRIRALGPLLLVFMTLGVAGATLTTSFVGNNPKLLKAVGEFQLFHRPGRHRHDDRAPYHRFRRLRHRRLVDTGFAAPALREQKDQRAIDQRRRDVAAVWHNQFHRLGV